MFVEESRLRSLNDLLADIGIDVLLYEDFAGATYDLLRDLAASLPPSLPANGAAATVAGKTLLDSFNDETNSANIITYLKVSLDSSTFSIPTSSLCQTATNFPQHNQLLTSAWIQSHPDDFRPFLPGTDIVRYCKTSIDPHLSEIDHVGIMGLFNLLLKPAGFALEVIYLDRSPGEEVNTYRLEPTPSTIAVTPAPSTLHQSQRQRQQQGLPIPTTDDIPTIRLLYRP